MLGVVPGHRVGAGVGGTLQPLAAFLLRTAQDHISSGAPAFHGMNPGGQHGTTGLMFVFQGVLDSS